MTIYELIDNLIILNPLLVYVERYEPDESQRLIIRPKSSKDKETQSSRWGRVLRVSIAPIEDEILKWRREEIREMLDAGRIPYVSFNPTNPVFGPSEAHKKICRVGVDDIFDMVTEETFRELIKMGEANERNGDTEPIA